MKSSIIYEDKNILAINKPAGVVVHPDKKHKTDTLIQQIIKKHPEIKNVGDPSTSSGQENLRPGIVHRLDKNTSGVMLVSKNQKTFDYLKKQFQNRKIKKTYIALVEGNVKEKKDVIKTPVKRFTKSREAETSYKVIKRFEKYSLLEVSPKTGRTHQIRLHLKSIGHPIVCEKLYIKRPRCPFGLNRHFLHAQSLELKLIKGEKIKIEAGLPDDLQKVLNKLEECDKN
jgi:23S rRNA pseudouridine1911/1915/1917 synthase